MAVGHQIFRDYQLHINAKIKKFLNNNKKLEKQKKCNLIHKLCILEPHSQVYPTMVDSQCIHIQSSQCYASLCLRAQSASRLFTPNKQRNGGVFKHTGLSALHSIPSI